ncbi:hypothetical protein HAX54_002615 [Datura stramonium]|uniref:S-protein homolog n=1 Tax=Datura stramonium TaxID=4076 RepID=A0ABS8T5P5_DATST|nr:hypothetical protein [Datura stramonium]
MACSSQHHQFVICLFLLSFLSVTNSQSSPDNFSVYIHNITPDLVVGKCYADGVDYDGELSIKPGRIDEFIVSGIDPSENHTLACDLKLGTKHGFFKLFSSNDTSICHTSEICNWEIREDGLCMLVPPAKPELGVGRGRIKAKRFGQTRKEQNKKTRCLRPFTFRNTDLGIGPV